MTCASTSRWRASTAWTIATHRPSFDPKWWISIRWLVPSAAAMARRLRSPMPFAATWSIARSRSCCFTAVRLTAAKCTIWYMKSVRVSIDVPQSREEVYDFLDVMANHESFNDHFLVDWRYSGPERGVGSRVRVRTRGGIGSDVLDIRVVAAEAP